MPKHVKQISKTKRDKQQFVMHYRAILYQFIATLIQSIENELA